MSEKVTDQFIYALFFIEDGCEEIFYAGRTDNIKNRFNAHLNDNTNSKKARFIRHLKKKGIQVNIKVLQESAAKSDEALWITNLEGAGHILTNSKSGDSVDDYVAPVLSFVTGDELRKAVWSPNPLYKDQRYLKKSGFTFIRIGKKYSFEVRHNGKSTPFVGNPLLGEKLAFDKLAEVANKMVV